MAGSVAEPLPLVKVTDTPPAPAGADSVTVPIEDEPPVTGLGDRVKPVIVPCPAPEPGLMVSIPLTVLPEVPVMVAMVVLLTLLVFTGKVPLLDPAGIVMLMGTVAEPVLLVSVTTTPPAPAGEPKVTVPVDNDPPLTGFGVKVIPVSVP